jgi:hypothetical protein
MGLIKSIYDLVGRAKDVKVKPLDLADRPVKRLFELAHSNPDTCWICLGKFWKGFGLIDEDDEIEFRMMETISRELDMMEKQMEN